METALPPRLLAAYGTLMRGQMSFLDPSARAGMTYAGDCLIPGTIHLVVAEAGGAEFRHPALALSEFRTVRGELFRLGTRIMTAERVLAALDDYEEMLPDDSERSVYLRRIMTVRRADGSGTEEAWVYVYNRPVAGLPLIESGDWRQR